MSVLRALVSMTLSFKKMLTSAFRALINNPFKENFYEK